MCGGFALSLASPQKNGRQLLLHQALYHAGKTFTYIFLGVLAAALGVYLQRFSTGLGYLAGALLILIGLNTFGAFRRATRLSAFLETTPLCGILRGFLQPTNALSAFLLGLFNGFLPCPLIYAMLAYATTLHSLPAAMATMAVFGLGTMPALAMLSTTGGWLKNRMPLLRISGALTIALGIVTIARGFEAIHICCH